MGLTVRTLLRDEVSSLADLAAEAAPLLRFTPEDLERNLFEPGASGENLRLALADGARIVGVACGTVRPLLDSRQPSSSPEGSAGHVKLLAVRATERRRGHGSRLLAELEGALREQNAQRILLDGAAPVYLQPGVPTTSRRALSFFRRHGYVEVGQRRSLAAVLDRLDLDTRRDEERLGERGFEVRRARTDERESLVAAVRRSFSPAWAEEVDHSLDFPRASLHVALRGGSLSAFAVAGLWARNAFGPMGTLEACRGQGVGTTLLRRCLRDLSQAGEKEAVISWIGPETFYRRSLGVTNVLTYAVLLKDRPSDHPSGN